MKTNSFGRRNTASVSGAMTVAAAAMSLPLSLSAALSVYEPFNYTAASTLAGQNGGTGFSGAWTAGTGSSTVSNPGLTYSGLTVVGNRATTPAASATTQNRSEPLIEHLHRRFDRHHLH